jgi:hypothetical protein
MPPDSVGKLAWPRPGCWFPRVAIGDFGTLFLLFAFNLAKG